MAPHKWNDFFRLAKGLVAGVCDFSPQGDYDKVHMPVPVPLSIANVVSSRIEGTDLHRIVLDLDVDAALIPSSTPGHHHLIIDKAMSWPVYKNLLTQLAIHGVIEHGFVHSMSKRKATWVRTPWTTQKASGATNP